MSYIKPINLPTVFGQWPGLGAGFTLIELILVVTLLSFLTILVPPALSGNSSSELKKTVRELAGSLRYARNKAITGNHQVALLLNLDSRTYTFSGLNKNQKQHQIPKNVEIELISALSEFQKTMSAYIRFYPDGSSTGGKITLALRNRQYLINISWITGKVVVHEDSV